MTDKPLSDRVLVLEVQAAERDERIEQSLKRLTDDVAQIKEYATRWRGGFSTILILGTILGGVAAGWDHIVHFFK